MAQMVDSDQPAQFRDLMVNKLRSEQMITSAEVERAFRVVPRHEFVPQGTSLADAYNADESVTAKVSADGVVISTISAPFIQARMIEQSGLGSGMSVLEIGSGGYNAGLLAEVVGPGGRVVSVDIDPDVTKQASARLVAAGYGGRVAVVCADAERGVPGVDEPFDVIIVTVGAWDIPPAWLGLLAASGRLVVPLRMNGITRSIGFRREGSHLECTSAEVCGFVPIQGSGAHEERVVTLTDADGRRVELRFDGELPDDASALGGALSSARDETWSRVTIEHGVSFADLYLWFASFLPGFCRVAAQDGTALAAERRSWFPFGVVRDGSFAYLAVRPALEGDGVEFGARAYGERPEIAATAMVEQIQAWDQLARGGPAPTFAYWPTSDQQPPVDEGTAVFGKPHGQVTIAWPRHS